MSYCKRRSGSGGVAFPVAGAYFENPIGSVYSSNISPDSTTGIGSWTLGEFARAMRHGVSRDGRHLFPVFPYTHFVALSDRDISALFVFLKRADSVRYTPPEAHLPLPPNIRVLLTAWKFVFARGEPYDYDKRKSESWNRGAYITLGIGHCGACHSPRNIFLAERSDARFGADSSSMRWNRESSVDGRPSI